MCLLKRARINSVCNYNSSWWRNSLQLIQRVFRRLADQTRPLKHTTWTPSYHFNHTLCRQDTHLRWRWWRIWWWWWCVFAGWSESSTAPRTALRVSTLSPLTDKQWDPFRVNPTQQWRADYKTCENSGEMLTIKTLAALSSCEITSGAPSAAIMVLVQWRAMRCIVGLSGTSGQWVHQQFGKAFLMHDESYAIYFVA